MSGKVPNYIPRVRFAHQAGEVVLDPGEGVVVVVHGAEVLVAAAVDAQRHESVLLMHLLLRSVQKLVVQLVVALLRLLLLLHPLPLERGAARPLAEAGAEPAVLLNDI